MTDLDVVPLMALADRFDRDRVLTVVADVRDVHAMTFAAQRAVQRFGGIDVVVAGAGIGSFGSMLNIDPEAFKRVIDVNVTGVFNTVHAALPSIIERRGYVLAVSSMGAFTVAPGTSAYNASKAAVEQAADALRLEVGYLGVDVGCAYMSWIDTPLVRELRVELGAFNQVLAALPGPLGKTITVAECGAAFVSGIERRKRRVYCPRWVGLFRWLRPLVSTRIGERGIRRLASKLLPALDAQAAALGRHFIARTEALETVDELGRSATDDAQRAQEVASMRFASGQ